MKQNLLKKSIALVFVAFITLTGYSQMELNTNELSSDWALLGSQNGVELYVRTENCQRPHMDKPLEYSFFKFVNTTNSAKSIEFQFANKYADGRCNGCSQEFEKSISVDANASIEGNCDFVNAELSLLIDNPNLHHLNEPLELSSIAVLNLIVK